jgi:threonine synthase
MQLYSTKNKTEFVSLGEAVMKGLPDDNGLFMPREIPRLGNDFFTRLPDLSIDEIGFEVCKTLFQGAIPENDLRELIAAAINFPVPLVEVEEHVYSLELWHGPSLAFKDFGARFMAQIMSYFNRGNERELVILVATSGDTGGAVAAGFYQTIGTRVVILYPTEKVSPLQEKQLTTLGANITALEIDGTFDDCQALVKQAFLDAELNRHIRLTSANSINIARLIPQSFYYFEAYKQLLKLGNTRPVVFSVPSGNFGNLTAGLLAQQMGLPIQHFVAATNANDVVPEYLSSGTYEARPSIRTLSNAMDVGAPSNFARMLDLFNNDWQMIAKHIHGFRVSDLETTNTMREVRNRTGYILDPHGAVGYRSLKQYQKLHPETVGVFLETAHPAKFLEHVEQILGEALDIPLRLAELSNKEKQAHFLSTDFTPFKTWLLDNLPSKGQ